MHPILSSLPKFNNKLTPFDYIVIIQRKQVRIIFYYSLHNIEQGDTHRYLPVLFLYPVSAVAHKSFHSKAVIQNALAQAKVFRGYLQQFVISKKLQTLFQAQDAGRN